MVRRRYHLHAPGLLYGCITIFVGVAAILSQSNLLIWLFAVMVTAVLISGLVSGAMMMGVQVRRVDPSFAAVGEPLVVQYVVSNRNRLMPVFNVVIEELNGTGDQDWRHMIAGGTAWVMHVGPKESVHGEALFNPLRRGAVNFERIRIWTTFPFGMFKKSITLSQPQRILLMPQTYQLQRRVLAGIHAPGISGLAPSSRPGAGDDYYGMRDFRPGDSMKQIAWKRAAGLDQLVSIERTKPTPPRLRIELDLTRGDALRAQQGDDAAESLEERSISLAASLMQAAGRQNFEVALNIRGCEYSNMPAQSGRRHMMRLMSALASIDLSAPRATRTVQDTLDGGRCATVAIHPAGIEPGAYPSDALHLSASQLDAYIIASRHTTPTGSRSDEMRIARQEAAA